MWIILALIGQIIGGTSALFDKLIIKKYYPNPIGYAFWLGVLGVFALMLVPFGFSLPSDIPLIVGIVAGISFIIGMLMYFKALSSGHVFNIIILIGALLPIATFAWSWMILQPSMAGYQMSAFLLLVGGSALLFFTEPEKIRHAVFINALGAAVLLGFSTVLSKFVYASGNFVSGFVIIKMGSLLGALMLLAIPHIRRKLLSTHPTVVRSEIGYLANRTYAGLGSMVLQYAIALGIPPLVDALYNVQLVVVLVGGWFLLRERSRGWNLFGKIIAMFVVGFGILWLSLGNFAQSTEPVAGRSITWGVTFSDKFAKQFDMNWRDAYEALYQDLGVRNIRLVAYWDDIEQKRGIYDFSNLDYEMGRARAYNARVILVVGQKVPRWPECHTPAWVPNVSEPERRDAFLTYLTAVIERYRHDPSLDRWQIENEPYLGFGECPLAQTDLLAKEIQLAHDFDPEHAVILTDGGEFGRWYRAAKQGDAFGTTMYLRVHSDTFGYFDYHLPPAYFRLKTALIRFLIGDQEKKFMVSELDAEPWLHRQLYETTPEEQLQHFDAPFLRSTISYAVQTGFDEYYLWGAEWWYWMKVKQGNPEFWNIAKETIKRSSSR